MVTQLTKLVCILATIISPWRWREYRSKHVAEDTVNKLHHKFCRASVGYLHILNVIFNFGIYCVRKRKHVEPMRKYTKQDGNNRQFHNWYRSNGITNAEMDGTCNIHASNLTFIQHQSNSMNGRNSTGLNGGIMLKDLLTTSAGVSGWIKQTEQGNEPAGYTQADKLNNCQIFKTYPTSRNSHQQCRDANDSLTAKNSGMSNSKRNSQCWTLVFRTSQNYVNIQSRSEGTQFKSVWNVHGDWERSLISGHSSLTVWKTSSFPNIHIIPPLILRHAA
jgi:hypothetical protein